MELALFRILAPVRNWYVLSLSVIRILETATHPTTEGREHLAWVSGQAAKRAPSAIAHTAVV
jgi:hypothetical protein